MFSWKAKVSVGSDGSLSVSIYIMLLRVNQQGEPVDGISPHLGTAVFKRGLEKNWYLLPSQFLLLPLKPLSMILLEVHEVFLLGLENCHFLEIYWLKFFDPCFLFCWCYRLSFSASLRHFNFSSYFLPTWPKVATVFLLFSLTLTSGLLFFSSPCYFTGEWTNTPMEEPLSVRKWIIHLLHVTGLCYFINS